MDWYPQQLFTAEQAAAGTFWVLEKLVFPQALFTAEQAPAVCWF